jgi:hypothetical protein
MKSSFEMESLHHHHHHPPSSKALKWSRLYKWFLLVVALVVLSAIRYYHWSVDEKISADQAETRIPKQQHKKIRVEEENVHSPKSETDEKVVSNDTTALLSIRLIPPYDKTKAAIFTNESCILTNTEEWFPSSTNTEWQLRAPRFMILGAQDSGTRLLANNLVKQQHSSISSNGHVNQQVAYFAQPTFLRTQPQQQRIHVWKARQRMYAKDYPTKVLQQNSSRITMDVTPDYLFYGHALSTRILCVCPWVQMLVIFACRMAYAIKEACRK